uniref:Glutathione S-transferase A4-like n=1 Tax=Saccoglossus kowalevskii TaxID=10224 RepID=A0ABM0MQU1_SACKO|nr:PREDICTED: glutathione S-transferase A4-like [Saccoglossus kowalevskii]
MTTDTKKAHLTYVNGRGLSESIRIIMAATGIEFQETFLQNKEQFETLRKAGDLLFMQVPLLEIDGMKLVQTNAIIRYIARKYDMYGKTLEEKTRIDMLNEGARDFLRPFIGVGWVTASTEDDLKKIREKILPRYLPIFENEVSRSTSGYLVGDNISMVDLTLLECLLNCDDYIPGVLDDFPKLKAFQNKVSSLPRIKAFLDGPQRKGKMTEEYIRHCKTLGMSAN